LFDENFPHLNLKKNLFSQRKNPQTSIKSMLSEEIEIFFVKKKHFDKSIEELWSNHQEHVIVWSDLQRHERRELEKEERRNNKKEIRVF